MERREFITLIGGAAVAWPLGAMAQQPVMPVIGFLHAGSLDGYANHVVAFRQGLNEAGFIPNQNVAIEYRWAAGQYDRLPALASELTGRQVAVLVASETGLVASLRRPEGNVTGVSFASRALAVKRLELIRELLPQATAIAVLENSQNPMLWSNTKSRRVSSAISSKFDETQRCWHIRKLNN